MNKKATLTLSTVAAFAILAGITARADNMATIAIAPSTGVVTLAPQWSIGGSLAGFHHMAQDLSLGGGANQLHSITRTAIPPGGDVSAFTLYIAGTGAATPHADIGSKLTPNTYSALTSADPDVGYGPVNMYFIHQKSDGDYFSVIVPSSGTASSVTDLKPMDGPGGPATGGASGYFGLTFAAADLGYGGNLFYYLRTDAVSGYTQFGTLVPALLGTSTDKFDLGIGGYGALAFTGTDVGYGTDKMYYTRLDAVTGFTILGTLNPLTGRTKDIANLGSVFSTLTFAPGDLGFGISKFYTTGAFNPTWQSVSFAAIDDRALQAGSFTVSPSASSGLPITLTVVTGSATISAPVSGVFTVTPTAPGLITLQAAQAGQVSPTPYEYNMLRQAFIVTGGVPDFNSDFKSDLVWSNSSNGDRFLWLMNGTAVSSSVYLGNIAPVWEISGTGDFNSDGDSDIVWSNTSTGDRFIWLMNGTTLNSSVYLGIVGPEWEISGTGDFNGDGHTDLIWSNSSNGNRFLWLMNGTTLNSSVYLGNVGAAWLISGTGDFNGDGKLDIVWSNTTSGDVFFWLMDRTTLSSSVYLGNVGAVWQIDGTGDFNNDGKTDLVWSHRNTGIRFLWLMNGTAFGSDVYLGYVAPVWQIRN